MAKVIKFPMDKINMTDWQKITLQEKFGKKTKKKHIKSILLFLLGLLLVGVFFSLLFFPDIESQVLISSNYTSPGFLKLGVYLYG